MVFRIEELKEKCATILAAVDSNELSILTETLELKSDNSYLYMSVTNREYYAQVKFKLDEPIEFHATVNANLFLKLISQITTDTVEFKIQGNVLVIKGNGVYKLPLIFDGEKLLELPQIVLNNITSEFDIETEKLLSILNYNSKELNRGAISKPVQRLYYVDDYGCITFTSGACVNTFSLNKPIKLLLNQRLVKLFRLFKQGMVHFSLAYDALSDDIIQTKVKFENENITITSILTCDDSLLASVPVNAIRARANNMYAYSIVINKAAMMDAINRLLLFINASKSLIPVGTIEFSADSMVIYDNQKENQETIFYDNDTNIDYYEMKVDLLDIKNVLEACTEQHVNMSFGDHQALVMSRGYITNIIPEVQ